MAVATGYVTQEQPANVADGATSTVDFDLTPSGGGGSPTDLVTTLVIRGTTKVDLVWSDGGATVDVYRCTGAECTPTSDGVVIATVANDGSHRDNLGRNPASGAYRCQVCNAGNPDCSNEAEVMVS